MATPAEHLALFPAQVQAKLNQLRVQESRLSGVFFEWQERAKADMTAAEEKVKQAEQELER
jgi:hypothetical protein